MRRVIITGTERQNSARIHLKPELMADFAPEPTARRADILTWLQLDPLAPDTRMRIPPVMPLGRCVVAIVIVELIPVDFFVVVVHFDRFDVGHLLDHCFDALNVTVLLLSIVVSPAQNR